MSDSNNEFQEVNSMEMDVEAPEEDNAIAAKRDRFTTRRDARLEVMEAIFERITDEEAFAAISPEDLPGIIKRLRELFADFERAHDSYRAITRLASNELYVNVNQQYTSRL